MDACTGTEVEEAAEAMQPGDVILLENTRFNPEEKENDPGFAKQIAGLAAHPAQHRLDPRQPPRARVNE